MTSLFSPSTFADPRNLLVRKGHRTHVSTTDRLDAVYTPRLPLAPAYAHHFTPTVITNVAGELNGDMMDDLMDTRYQPRRAAMKG